MVTLKFNPHPQGIKQSYAGVDQYHPEHSESKPKMLSFAPGEEVEVSDQKAEQLLADFPKNFTVVKGKESKKAEFSEEPVKNKMSAPDKKK